MNKLFKWLSNTMVVLLGLFMLSGIALADITIWSPEVFYLGNSNNIQPVDTNYELGSSGIPVKAGYFTTLTATTFTGVVMKADYNAHTILYATTDNTPAALTVTEQTVVGRQTGGNISALAIGITDDDIVEIDDSGVADNEYAKFTANGLEGRAYADVKTDLSLNNVENTALSTWAGTSNITTLGTITTGVWNAGAVTSTGAFTGTSANLTANSNQLVLDSDDGGGITTTITDSATTAAKVITLPDATGTVALTANKLSDFASTSSTELAGVISDETGTGTLVYSTSPSFTTPTLGAATGTTLALKADNNQIVLDSDEGSGYTTTLSGTATTSAKTITFPNATGTVITTGNLSGITDVGTDAIDDTMIDWGSGANQVNADDIGDGSTNVIITSTQETNFGTAYTHSGLTSGNPHSVTKSDVGLGSVENTALSTWAGTSNITTLGTVTTGTLSTGSVLGGVTMTLGTDADFDMYYRASNVLTRLAPNTAASNKFLRMIGTGAAGQAPSWEALGASDIPDISATYVTVAGDTMTGALAIEHADGVVLGKDDATNIAGKIKMFAAGANAFYNTFTSGENTANATYTLPVAMPTSDKYLKSTSAGVMSWDSPTSAGEGLVGVATTTLSGNITLTPGTDPINQILNPNGADRIITLATAAVPAGSKFVIRNTMDRTGTTYYLNIKQGSTILQQLRLGNTCTYVYDGTNWRAMSFGATEADIAGYYDFTNLAAGQGAIAKGVAANAYGTGANASGYAALSLGYGSTTSADYTIATGMTATASATDAIAIGKYATASTVESIAKGTYSTTSRYSEEWRSADGASVNKYGYGQVDWYQETTTNAATEIFLRGTASNRFTILASSGVSFRLNVIAKNNTNQKGKVWEIKGGIKRDGSNNTTLIGTVSSEVISTDAKVDSDTGTAESGTGTTLVDTDKSWTPDAYIGKLVKITAGTGNGQVRSITDNDATSVTVATWDTNPSSDSVYLIYDSDPADWAISVTADDTNESLKIEATGETGQTIRFNVAGDYSETRF